MHDPMPSAAIASQSSIESPLCSDTVPTTDNPTLVSPQNHALARENNPSSNSSENAADMLKLHTPPVVIRRIRLSNMNKYFNKKETLKWLTKVPEFVANPPEWLNLVSVKKAPKNHFAFLSLPTPELHQKALSDLSSFRIVCRSKEIEVKEFLEKERVFVPRPIDPNDLRTPLERVADQTTPYWRMTYEEQLACKHKIMCDAVHNCFKKAKCHKGSTALLPPVPSPQLEGYRSKCEFQIGLDADRMPTVGFNSGSFLSGNWAVISPRGLKHVNQAMLNAVDIIQDFIRSKDIPVWDKSTKTGFFRLVLMRTTSLDENMFILQVDDRDYTLELCLEIEQEFQAYFMERAAQANVSVKVLGIQYYSGTSDQFPQTEIKQLVGDSFLIKEMVNGFQFNISPHSFFQANQPATEKLYGLISEWIQEEPTVSGGGQSDQMQTTAMDIDTTKHTELDSTIVTEQDTNKYTAESEPKKKILLDLCCGTGTIGICLSKQFDHIHGIDIVKEAIADAEQNAQNNQVAHISYTASPIEKYITTLLRMVDVQETEVIAVLDPPRAGINKSVIKAIRTCPKIERLIYVSCDIQQVQQTNLYDLIREPSGSHPGTPFTFVRAQVVDMFPQTKAMEVVMEFQRRVVGATVDL